MRPTLTIVLTCLALGGYACGDARREEAGRLLQALESLDVGAPVKRREARIEALRSLPIEDPGLARVREQCVTVHAGLLAAEREQAAAGRALKAAAAMHAGQGIPPTEAERITQAIARSEQAWAAARAALPKCEAATRDLVLHKR